MRDLISALLILAVCTPAAYAREWTDSTGKYKVEAEFIDHKDGKVRLKNSDGKIVTVAVDKLSKEDQAFVRSQANASPPGPAVAAPSPPVSAPPSGPVTPSVPPPAPPASQAVALPPTHHLMLNLSTGRRVTLLAEGTPTSPPVTNAPGPGAPAASGSPSPAPAASRPTPPKERIKPGDSVSVTREGTKLLAGDKVLAELKKGATLEVLEVKDRWVMGQVLLDGKKEVGWVAEGEVELPAAEKGFKEGVLWVEGGESGPYKLWFLSAQSEKAKLMAMDAGAWMLTYSPDMEKVAYTGFLDKGNETPFLGKNPFGIVDVRGRMLASSKSERVIDSCGFSPDNRFYAFGREEAGPTDFHHYALYVADLISLEQQPVARNVGSAKWASTSGAILYQTAGGDHELYHLATIKGGSPEKVSPHVSSYEPSPSNAWAYVAVGKQKVYPLPPGMKEHFKESRWSSDGRFFAFVADGTPMVFDGESGKMSACAPSGEASALSFSRNGNLLACLMLDPQGGQSGRVRIWNCLTGKSSETLLVQGTPKLRGWIGEQVAVSVNGKLYLVRSAAASATLLHDESPLDTWRWPRGECCMLLNTNGQFRVREIGLAGDVTEPFPAINGLSVDLTDADMMTTMQMGLAGLSETRCSYCRTERLAFSTRYLLSDLRLAVVPSSKPDMIVISVKERGKQGTQYLLRRGNATPQKIGDLAGAFPHWVTGTEQVVFFVHGDSKEGPVALQLYDVPSGKWRKLADSIAPRGPTFLMTDAGRDYWSF